MPELSHVDALWFGATRESHRIRPATPAEASRFEVRRPGVDKLMTVVRSYDGTRESYAFRPDDDLEKVCGFELAGWFEADLNGLGRAGADG